MCGICGYLQTTGRPAAADPLAPMMDRLHRRGPDEDGCYRSGPVALGHRRLQIIDLTTGRQPIANEDETVWVIFNGEIYNYPELRRQLEAAGHRFRTRTDTEVLVHLYEDRGPNFVEALNGMFALALWDEPRRRLVLARDPMGQKPLYYAAYPGGFAFASEIKSLLAHPEVDRTLDPQSLSRYLFYEYVPAPWSIFAGIRKLPAGHRLVHEAGQARITRYWSPAVYLGGRPALSFEDAAERLWHLLREAVRRHLASDVPLGVFLSGGIDSTSVLAAMTEVVPASQIKTFSIGFDDPSFDESSFGRLVARHYGTEHHAETFSLDRLLALLPEMAEYLDEPFGDASVLPTHLLSRFCRQRVTVALGGDGGDELLAGYPTFQAAFAHRCFQAVPAPLRRLAGRLAGALPVNHDNLSYDFLLKQFLKGADEPLPLANQLWLGSFAPDEQRRLLSDDLRAELRGYDPGGELMEIARALPGRDFLTRLQSLYCLTYLPEDILTKVDRASMACSLEVRSPLLDKEVVEFLLTLPPHYKTDGLRTKKVLHRAVVGKVPAAILRRGKKGFGIPVAKWLLGGLREFVGDLLSPPRLRRQGLFNPVEVERLVKDHAARRRDNRKPLWTLLMFQLWYDRYGPSPTADQTLPSDVRRDRPAEQLLNVEG